MVGDSAFAGKTSDSIIKSYQNVVDRNGVVRQRPELNRQATLLRQMSEWDMRSVQAGFPRLRDTIRYEERGERKRLLSLVVLLHYFRASRIGQNQLASVFMPWLEEDVCAYIAG